MDNENGQEKTTKMGMSKMVIGAVAAVIIIVAIGAVMFLKSNSTQQTAGTQNVSEESMESKNEAMMEGDEVMPEGEGAMMEESGVTVVNIEGGSFYFKPNVINAKKGEKIKVVFNAADAMHDFVIDELDVKSDIIKSGQTTEVEFTADQVGEFEFYCSVGNHRAQGMVGTLVVTE